MLEVIHGSGEEESRNNQVMLNLQRLGVVLAGVIAINLVPQLHFSSQVQAIEPDQISGILTQSNNQEEPRSENSAQIEANFKIINTFNSHSDIIFKPFSIDKNELGSGQNLIANKLNHVNDALEEVRVLPVDSLTRLVNLSLNDLQQPDVISERNQLRLQLDEYTQKLFDAKNRLNNINNTLGDYPQISDKIKLQVQSRLVVISILEAYLNAVITLNPSLENSVIYFDQADIIQDFRDVVKSGGFENDAEIIVFEQICYIWQNNAPLAF